MMPSKIKKLQIAIIRANNHSANPSQLFLTFALAFISTFGYFIYCNWDALFVETMYEQGDYALLGISTLAAKKLELSVSAISAELTHRQPGALIHYYCALVEFIFNDVLNLPSPVIALILGVATFNLFFQIVGLLIVYVNLRNKLLIIPGSIFLFLFMNSLNDQLVYATPNIMVASPLLVLILSSAHAISHKGFRVFPIFALTFTLCILWHPAFTLPVAVISLPVFWQMARVLWLNPPTAVSSEDKKFLWLGGLILPIGFLHPLYDQFFGSGNLGRILMYVKSLKAEPLLERLELHLGKALLFVSAHFVDMFRGREFTVVDRLFDAYFTTPTTSVLIWTFFLSAGLYVFSCRAREDRFVKVLFILIGIGVLVGIYISMSKSNTSGLRLYHFTYALWYLYSFVAGFVFYIILCLDRICSRLFSCGERWSGWLATAVLVFVFAETISIPLLFSPSAHSFFNKKSGYFGLSRNAKNMDPNIGGMAAAIAKHGNSFALEIDNNNWRLSPGIALRLMRMGYPVAVTPDTTADIFGIKRVNQLPVAPKPRKVYLSRDPHPERQLIYCFSPEHWTYPYNLRYIYIDAAKQQITTNPNAQKLAGKLDLTTNAMTLEKGESGSLMYGPVHLWPGHFQATYIITAEPEVEEGTEVGSLDISGYIPPFTLDTLAQVQIKSARGEQTIKLNFDAKNPLYQYQIKASTNGKIPVSIKSVHIEQRAIGAKPTQLKVSPKRPEQEQTCNSLPPVSGTSHLQVTPDPTPQYLTGKVAMISERGQSGVFMYGPARLQSGHYQATYTITAESEVEGTEIGSLEISGNIPPSFSENLAQIPLKAARGEQTINLIFDAKNPLYQYQFLVIVSGLARVNFKNVDVKKIS